MVNTLILYILNFLNFVLLLERQFRKIQDSTHTVLFS